MLEYAWDHPHVRSIGAALPYFVALPTTSGTGSEVGRSSVISDDDTHLKRIIFSPQILARAVFADPELTVGLPAAVTAATGMDALTHNVESYLSPAYHPLCDGIALEGTRIAARALAMAVREPDNLAARGDMMMSSMMGAIAFQKDLGAVHSCAHALGTVCDLHHGLANALMIDTVLAWNVRAAPGKFEQLAARRRRQRRRGRIHRVAEEAEAGDRHRPESFRRRREARVDPAPGRDRDCRHLPLHQPAKGHPGRLRAPLRGGLVTARRNAERIKVGISACFFHADAKRPIFNGKTLQYVEQSMAHWVMSTDALAVMIPSPVGDTQKGERHSTTMPSGSTRSSSKAAPTSGPAATARSRWTRSGTATASATTTRPACCARSPRAASRCSASAAACR